MDSMVFAKISIPVYIFDEKGVCYYKKHMKYSCVFYDEDKETCFYHKQSLDTLTINGGKAKIPLEECILWSNLDLQTSYINNIGVLHGGILQKKSVY